MADIVTTQTIADTSGVKYVVKMTNVSDGTGENLVKKVDASELTFMTEDGARTIARIYWSINTTDTKTLHYPKYYRINRHRYLMLLLTRIPRCGLKSCKPYMTHSYHLDLWA